MVSHHQTTSPCKDLLHALGILHIWSRCAAWPSCGFCNTFRGGCLWLRCLQLDPFPLTDCLVRPQWERMCLILLGLDVLGGWGGSQEGLPLLWGEAGVVQSWEDGFVRVGLGVDVEGGCDQDVKWINKLMKNKTSLTCNLVSSTLQGWVLHPSHLYLLYIVCSVPILVLPAFSWAASSLKDKYSF